MRKKINFDGNVSIFFCFLGKVEKYKSKEATRKKEIKNDQPKMPCDKAH